MILNILWKLEKRITMWLLLRGKTCFLSRWAYKRAKLNGWFNKKELEEAQE